MSKFKEFFFLVLQFYVIVFYVCSYFDGCLVCLQVVMLVYLINVDVYLKFVCVGFWCSGIFIYCLYCDDCYVCMLCCVVVD